MRVDYPVSIQTPVVHVAGLAGSKAFTALIELVPNDDQIVIAVAGSKSGSIHTTE